MHLPDRSSNGSIGALALELLHWSYQHSFRLLLKAQKPIFGKYVVMTIFIIFFTPKLFFAIFHLIEDIIQVIAFGASKMSNTGEPISRLKFLKQSGGFGIMSFTLISNFFGVFVGKYRYRIKKRTGSHFQIFLVLLMDTRSFRSPISILAVCEIITSLC